MTLSCILSFSTDLIRNTGHPVYTCMSRGYLLLAKVFIIGLTLRVLISPDVRGNDKNEDIHYQVSTIDALLQGSYDGVMRYDDVKRQGDFGIATFDGLDGEMVAVDGEFFQVMADGRVSPGCG
jgi:acetolactate decarboxylase